MIDIVLLILMKTIMMTINFIIMIIITQLFLTNATSGTNTFGIKEKSLSVGKEFHGITTLTFG